MEPEDLRLVCAGAEIHYNSYDENYTGRPSRSPLSNCGVTEGCTIQMLLRVRGGMPATAPRIKMPVSINVFLTYLK